jgi:type I restriction enzyme S subunit
VFASPLGIELIKRVDNGTAQPNLSAKSVKSYLIPLPPFAEQQRIVERLEDILPEIEKLQKDETKLEALQKSFPKKMKDSILQSAIQGRLTEQLESDGDARDLVRSIEKEKERLIKERKIKKEKPLPEITEDEIPFDIPNNWCWVRLNDLLMLGDGQKMNGQKYINMEVKYLRGQISGNVLNAGKFIEKGSKVILVDGENSGEVFTIPEDGYMGSTFKRLMIVVEEFWPYLEFFLKKQQTLFRNNKTGSAIPHLNKTLFKEMLVPLPPLSEQQRIVERLNQLLPLCDALD